MSFSTIKSKSLMNSIIASWVNEMQFISERISLFLGYIIPHPKEIIKYY